MIAIKFEDGKIVSWKYPCEDLEELKFAGSGFSLYDWSGDDNDIQYLKLVDNKLIIDEQEKQKENKRVENAKQVCALKTKLVKAKEDVEQVELFGMERQDYAEKKELCKEIICQLRALEKEMKI